MLGGPIRGAQIPWSLPELRARTTSPMFRAFGMFFDGWARVESDSLGGLEGMRRGVEACARRTS